MIILCSSGGAGAKVHLPVNILGAGFFSELHHLINHEVYGSSVLIIIKIVESFVPSYYNVFSEFLNKGLQFPCILSKHYLLWDQLNLFVYFFISK